MLFTILSTGVFSEKTFAESLEEKARKFYTAFDAADTKTMQEMVTTDFTFSNPFTPPMNLTAMQGFAQASKNSFEMSQHAIQRVVSSGNTVTIMGIFKGKYVQPFNGIPANQKQVEVGFTTVMDWSKDGRLWKMNTQNNSLAFMIQLGAIPDPTTQQGIPVVAGLYQKFGMGDIPGLVNSLDENISWDSHLNPLIKTARVYHGNKDVFNFFSDLKSNATITKFIPKTFYQSGDMVYVPGSFEYKNDADQNNYTVNWTMIWTIKNGKAVQFSEYFDHPLLKNPK